MPPYGSHMTRTPEEEALLRAKLVLSDWGYHQGDVIDYDNALDMLKEVILKDKK